MGELFTCGSICGSGAGTGEEDKSAELRASLDEAHKEDIARAQNAPPPKTVEAYRRVFGEFPSGWPPALEQ